MKRVLIILVAISVLVSSFCFGQTQNTTEVILPRGVNKRSDFESIFNSRQKHDQMPKAKEEFLLKLHSKPVKDKLSELKKISRQKYFEMLWDLPVPVTANTPKNAPLDYVVNYNGPEPPERTKINVLQIEIEIFAQQYKSAHESAKQDIENKLRSDLNEFFSFRVSKIQDRVKDAENKLNELKRQLSSTKNNQEQIVSRRLEELLR